MATIQDINDLSAQLKDAAKADDVIIVYKGDAHEVEADKTQQLEQFLTDNPDVTVEEQPEPVTFTYELGDLVTLLSGERGYVVGRAQYSEADDSYFIRYTAADGRLVESWWSEQAILDYTDLEELERLESAAANRT